MGGCCCSSRKAHLQLHGAPLYLYCSPDMEEQESLRSHDVAASAISSELLVPWDLEASIPDTYRPPPPPLPYDTVFGCSQSTDSDSVRETISCSSFDTSVTCGDFGESDCKVQENSLHIALKKLELSKSSEPCVLEKEDEDVCPICLEDYETENPKFITKCEHHYHFSCILEWMERSDACPICDQELDLFTTSLPSQFQEVTNCIETRVSTSENAALIRPVTHEEVRRALVQIHPTKSPGPDGFTASFYHKHWGLLGNEVIHAVLHFFQTGYMFRQFNFTHLALIPKVASPMNMTQFRPISLCNVIYKIIAKVLTNRLKGLMGEVISDSQSAFVSGRQITDNVLVVHELLHTIGKKRGKNGEDMMLKLDMSKAYDRVEWEFLLEVMARLGFHPTFCHWIKECITTTSFSALMNGSPTKVFRPSRGLRQGDPLSPFLFVLCAEGLSALIRRKTEVGALRGVPVAPSSFCVTHLFFADDSVLFSKATMAEAVCLKEILQLYELCSGQKINFEKSSVVFSADCPPLLQDQIVGVLGVRVKVEFGKYLGLQADFGASKKRVFDDIRNKVEAKALGWSEQFLSKAGKEVLIKSIALALPNYAMSCFQLPVGVCKDIERVLARYWWGKQQLQRGLHWAAWERLTVPKDAGGLGFQDIRVFNLAMLAKIGWRLLDQPSSLLARLLRAKYHSGTTILEAKDVTGSSWGWKGILKGLRILKSGLRWHVGDGTLIHTRSDPWLPVARPFKVKSLNPNLPHLVNELICPISHTWLSSLVANLFDEEDTNAICSIPLSKYGCSDRYVWHFSTNGRYNVHSGYLLATELCRNGELFGRGSGETSTANGQQRIWKHIWSLNVPHKIRHFIWTCCRGYIATRQNLTRRRVNVETVCPLCGVEEESESHLFFTCQFAQTFWYGGPLQLVTDTLQGLSFRDCWHALQVKYGNKEDEGNIFQMLAFGCWRIWKTRNEQCFKHTLQSPVTALDLFFRQISEFSKARIEGTVVGEVVMVEKAGPCQRVQGQGWQRPIPGVLKLNCDGAWSRGTHKGAYGWVLRSWLGSFEGAGGAGMIACSSALQAEALAVRSGLESCVTAGHTTVIVESDSLQLIQLLCKKGTDGTLTNILHDIYVLCESFLSITFQFAPRACNMVAHAVANHVKCMSGYHVWTGLEPTWMFNLLATDVGVSSRV